jgi:hypothetical protein
VEKATDWKIHPPRAGLARRGQEGGRGLAAQPVGGLERFEVLAHVHRAWQRRELVDEHLGARAHHGLAHAFGVEGVGDRRLRALGLEPAGLLGRAGQRRDLVAGAE